MKTSLTLCLALVVSLVVSPVTAANSSYLDLARAHEMRRLVKEFLFDSGQRSIDLSAGPSLGSSHSTVTSSRLKALQTNDDAPRLFGSRGGVSFGVLQDEPSSAEALSDDSSQATDEADQTGTNPINFTFDLRLYNEYQWLNTAGDGQQNVTTLEFRAPLFDGKLQFRVKARANYLEADLNDDGIDDVDEFGFGDLDLRLLTVPYVDMSKKVALAAGIEVFLDTASDDAIGSGSTSLGPQVFLVFFKPFDLPFIDLFAPAYQHKFSVDGNDVHQGLIDLFFLKTSADKKYWALVNPQFVLDYENDKEFMFVEAEAGMMLDDVFGTRGHSAYVRPSFGIGNDRPYDFSIEVGYKIVW